MIIFSFFHHLCVTLNFPSSLHSWTPQWYHLFALVFPKNITTIYCYSLLELFLEVRGFSVMFVRPWSQKGHMSLGLDNGAFSVSLHFPTLPCICGGSSVNVFCPSLRGRKLPLSFYLVQNLESKSIFYPSPEVQTIFASIPFQNQWLFTQGSRGWLVFFYITHLRVLFLRVINCLWPFLWEPAGTHGKVLVSKCGLPLTWSSQLC